MSELRSALAAITIVLMGWSALAGLCRILAGKSAPATERRVLLRRNPTALALRTLGDALPLVFRLAVSSAASWLVVAALAA